MKTKNKGFFITGTDTDIGKTVVALGLMKYLQQQGYKVSGFKPVSAGCQQTVDGLVNDDALQLQQASSITYPYEIINPYAFEPPIAPHIAAEQINVSIEIDRINSCYKQIAEDNDYVIVEGAGGWLVPINDQQTMAYIAKELNLPIVLVVGIKLGCLNHALLSLECISNSGCSVGGWIANNLTNNTDINKKNIFSLKQRLGAPLLATIPFQTATASKNFTDCFSNIYV